MKDSKPPAFNSLRRPLVLLAILGGHAAGAQTVAALPASNSKLVSDYLNADIGWGGEAASAVACGFRGPAWGQTFHGRLTALLQTHAGSPLQTPNPDGTVSSTAHNPSPAEQAAALKDLANSEAQGVNAANQPSANSSDPGALCNVIQQSLPDLDGYEDGSNPLWPDGSQ